MKKGTYVATEKTRKRLSKALKASWVTRRAKKTEANKKMMSDLNKSTPAYVKDMTEKYAVGVDPFGYSSKAISSEPNWKMIALELMKKYQ